MTKIYCDIADINLIKRFTRKKIVKGFTTNPSLMRKSGAKDYLLYSKQILKVTNKPISFEVFADNNKDMITQKKINKWGRNVYVKVPFSNSKGKFTGEVIKKLNRENIKLNITAVYTSNQTSRILKNINKKTKVIISIFAGRMEMPEKIHCQNLKSVSMSKRFKKMSKYYGQVLRKLIIIFRLNKLGATITTPPSLIEKIEKFGKTFNQLTTDTVKGF